MEFSFVQFLSGAGQFLLVAIVAFGAYCLVVSHLRFELLAERAAQGAAAIVAGRVASSSRPFLLFVFSVRGEGDVPPADAELRKLEQALRIQIRNTDRAALADESTLLALVEATDSHAAGILQRLRDALASSRRGTLKGALAAYPAEASAAAALIALARERLDGAAPAPAEPRAAATQAHTDGQTPAQAAKLIDPETGVLRTELLQGSLQKYLARLREADQPFSLLYVDADFMRRYNDQYGRARGDRILRAVSDYLQRRTREDDLIGRGPGGDEFAIALPLPGEAALNVARRLCQSVRRADKDALMDGLRVAFSIGVATWPAHGATARHVFESARIAVKQAKVRSRGTAALADGPAPQETMTDEPQDRL